MYKTITPAGMKRIETEAMQKGYCSGEVLMGRAAAAVARAVQKYHRSRGGKVIALCGTGNNGGDAVAALRMLAADESLQGECWLLDGSLSPDMVRELERLKRERPHIRVRRLVSETAYAETGVLTDAEGEPIVLPAVVGCLVDGLFGTGLSRPVCGVAAALCRLCREAYETGVPVVAVDIPSGLCGRTGQVLGECVQATETVTFHRPKPGLFLGQGLELAGKVTVADIGLLPSWDDEDGLLVFDGQEVTQLLPKRSRIGHKGTHGRVVLLCGSVGMAGAAAIAATAALRTGAGLVTVACPERILDTVQMLCPCATCLPLPEDAQSAWDALRPLLESADALGVGCGLGQSLWAQVLVANTLAWLSTHALPAVIDADGLNLLAKLHADQWDLSRCVLTPHPGEAGRLLGRSAAEVAADAVESAAALHQRYGSAVVLKGAASVLVTAKGSALNVLGTSAMGKGGSGDALTGVICALLAEQNRQYSPQPVLTVLQAACGLHGLAGCAAEKRLGNRGVLATDLCMELGIVVQAPCLPAADDWPAHGERVATQQQVMPPLRWQEPLPEDRQSATGIMMTTPASDPVNAEEKPDALCTRSALGRIVTVTVDRKLGETHPEHKDIVYPLNYGYVQDVLAQDNEWQDAYIYGETQPLDVFEGQVVAVIHRLDDVEDKWVVADPGLRLTKEKVWEATRFMEQYFQVEIVCL